MSYSELFLQVVRKLRYIAVFEQQIFYIIWIYEWRHAGRHLYIDWVWVRMLKNVSELKESTHDCSCCPESRHVSQTHSDQSSASNARLMSSLTAVHPSISLSLSLYVCLDVSGCICLYANRPHKGIAEQFVNRLTDGVGGSRCNEAWPLSHTGTASWRAGWLCPVMRCK